MYKVYVHIFPNGKRYVGVTKQDVYRRWQNGLGYKGQTVYFAILKYGWHNIEHKILYTGLTKDKAEDLEIKLIDEWKTYDRRFGYNIEKGGNLNKEIAETTKNKLSIANKGHIPWIKGKKHSDYSKNLNRIKHLGNKAWNKGIQFSEDSKHKMSSSKKSLCANGWLPANTKRVLCIETGIVYNSAKEAGRLLGLSSSHIGSCCTGKRKTTGGYHFRHYNDCVNGGDVYEQ